jgi:hypothetical protein
MKLLSALSLFILLMLMSFPATSDAFSRRSHHSETGPQTAPLNKSQVTTGDVSAQAVPEPPALLLLSVGVGLFAVGVMFKRLRRTA